MHILLINPGAGNQRVYPVSGKSTRLYGNALLHPVFNCPAFRMTLADYMAAHQDLIGNVVPGHQWIPVPEPDEAVPPTNRFLHLGVEVEFTATGLMVDGQELTFPLTPAQPPSDALSDLEEPPPLDTLTINQLRRLARVMKLDTQGSKEAIIGRIQIQKRLAERIDQQQQEETACPT